MRRIAQCGLAFLVLIGGLVITAGTAQACSCAMGSAGQPPIGADPTPSPTQTLAPEPTQPAVDFGTSTGSTWAVMFGIAFAVVLVVWGVVSLMQRRERRRPPPPPAPPAPPTG